MTVNYHYTVLSLQHNVIVIRPNKLTQNDKDNHQTANNGSLAAIYERSLLGQTGPHSTSSRSHNTLQDNHSREELMTDMNKSSAVAEMGDRGHIRHGPKRGRIAAVTLSQGELGPRLCRGLLPYQVAFASIEPFGHNRRGPKTAGCSPFRGSCDPI